MGALTKDYRRQFVPAIPSIPARDAETVCTTLPPPGPGEGPGHWENQCSIITLPTGYSFQVSMGQSVTVLEITDRFIKYQICGSVWVPNG